MKRRTDSAIDWERIELDYRAGLKSLREMAAEHGITHAAIRKKADKLGWERDLRTKIQARAEALVLVSAAVSTPVSAETRAAEKRVIDSNAQALADVRLGHRRDIRRGRDLTNRLLAELEQLSDQPELGQALVESFCSDPDSSPDDFKLRRSRLNNLLDRVLSLPARVGTLKTLSDALRNLINLEREAWGMTTDGKIGGTGEGGEAPKLSELDRAARVAAIIERARKAKAAAEMQPA